MTSAVGQGRGRLDVGTSKALGERLHETPGLAALRAEAARLAAGLDMPRQTERPWKYLDVTNLPLDAYVPGVGADGAMPDLVATDTSASLVQVNSETVSAETHVAGLTVVDFGHADEKQLALVEKHLGTAVVPGKSKLTATHYAFLAGGLLVHAAPNVEAKAAVRITRWLPSAGQLATPHTLVVAGDNSRLNVIEDYRSGEGDMVTLPVIEVVLGTGAEVRLTMLHRWGSRTQVFSEQHARTGRDSTLISLYLATGGRVVKGHIVSSLQGRGSTSELYGLVAGGDSQHIDFYTVQDHIAADTRSDLLFKAALKDSARSVYYGLTRIGLEAVNADANQTDRNLLLSPQAKADSDPVLEILTNNIIRAAHGATAGPVDDEQLFYLESRGIPRDEAESMLVHAFLGEVLDRVPDEALREELAAAVDAKLDA